MAGKLNGFAYGVKHTVIELGEDKHAEELLQKRFSVMPKAF
jgi:hypothetical protein